MAFKKTYFATLIQYYFGVKFQLLS